MANKAEEVEAVQVPPKSKKKLFIIIGAVVLVLLLAVVGTLFYLNKQRAAAAEAEANAEAPAAPAHAAAHTGSDTPPVYLPMDNMVVNLADPGGEKVAQVGITLIVQDSHAMDTVKAFMPTIRSGVLLLLAQRTSEELLTPEGKQKLMDDILRQTTIPFGGGDAPPENGKAKKKTAAKYPVTGVLFSSLIVQ